MSDPKTAKETATTCPDCFGEGKCPTCAGHGSVATSLREIRLAVDKKRNDAVAENERLRTINAKLLAACEAMYTSDDLSVAWRMMRDAIKFAKGTNS